MVRGLIACAFVASGSYDKILGYFGFTDFVAYGLVVLGVLILRRREPNLARPASGSALSSDADPLSGPLHGYLGTTLLGRPVESLIGVALTMTGGPFYYWWSKSRKTRQ